MKKFLIHTIVIIGLLVFEVLLFKLLPFFLRPNLFLSYIVFLGLFVSHTESVIYGFINGIVLDFIYLKIFGINSFLLTTIGYLVGWLNKRVNETFKKVQIIVLFLFSVIYFFLYIVFSLIFYFPVKILPIFVFNLISTVLFGYLIIQILFFIYKKNNLII
ncbi:MAG: rod shape-determining protein MreD [Endomicrobiia bacterium]